MLPGLLDSLNHNLSRRNGDVQLFEIGRVFSQQNGVAREGWRVAIALTGARDPRFWSGADRDAKADVYDLKGLVEELIERSISTTVVTALGGELGLSRGQTKAAGQAAIWEALAPATKRTTTQSLRVKKAKVAK